VESTFRSEAGNGCGRQSRRGRATTAKPKSVTDAELVAVLARLRYVRDPSQSAEGYIVFQHPGRSIPIVLQAFKPRTLIRPIYLAGIKGILEDTAPAAAEEFQAWLDGRVSSGPSEVSARR
jgi:hypothetical protein